jgi:hypothetical protein
MERKTLKNIDLINISNSITELMTYELDTKAGWNLGRNLRKIESILKDFGEFERKLLDEYAIKKDDGSIVINANNEPEIYPNSKSEYIEKHNELLNCESEIEFLTIPLSCFIEGKSKEIKPYLLFNLDFMIDENS